MSMTPEIVPAVNVHEIHSEGNRITKSRRNGQLFSCEPCRRNKLRCDHALPACGRCIKRGKSDACVYHPAPETKPRLPRNPVNKPRRTGVSLPDVSHRPSSNLSTHTFKSSSSSFNQVELGFLGPTSFSAIFTENEHRLEAGQGDMRGHAEPSIVVQERVTQGAEILQVVVNTLRQVKQIIRGRLAGFVGRVPEAVVEIWMEGMFSECDHFQDSSFEEFKPISHLIWRNTVESKGINSGMSFREWAEQCTGPGLRWEIIGIILTLAAIMAHEIDDWEGVFENAPESYIDRASFVNQMRKASDFCLALCYEVGVSELYIMFMHWNVMLSELSLGDFHYSAWQKSGEICDAVVAMGLHREDRLSAGAPFWLVQLRKKIFVFAYTRDKMTATFFGRPPRLAYKYCNVSLPLDLSDDELLLEGAELQKAIDSLTLDGWSTTNDPETGLSQSSTRTRLFFALSRVREEILDIALRPLNALAYDNTTEIMAQAEKVRSSLKSIQERLRHFIGDMPENEYVRTELHSMVGLSNRGPHRSQFSRSLDAYLPLLYRASGVHAEFLLARALVTRGLMDYKELASISKRLLELVLIGVGRKDDYRNMRSEMAYMYIIYGLPSAGVLAIELLKYTQSRNSPPFSRSEVIQDISVFIAALGALDPRGGNYSVCNQGRLALRRLLDQTLNAPPLPPPGQMTAQREFPLLDEINFSFPTENDIDFFQWLENTEFAQDV
ncbi:Hypothetical protein R9X50_00061300 [Acrodontium crateriforme]|uniref:Zn(2)-C6 fungal-type domain-containing protein n=1 Tax=Acrodontium crateriforme TaxID=150365 RepID=A0AAQ3M0L0_9PEZI|nr:Hypothetical protein R9X50_00061300 [Acrodontium crateriforme]